MTENMDIRDFLLLIIRNLFILIFCTFLGLSAALYYNDKAVPIYTADMQLFVSTPASAIDIGSLATGSSFSQQRVKSYADIIDGPATLIPVIEKLKLKTTPYELAKSVKASAPLDTVLISVSVTNKSPKMAAKIANEIGKQFAITASELEIPDYSLDSPVKVSVVKGAVPPKSPTSPKKLINLLLGLLLGFGLGLGIALLRLRFDDSVRNEDHLDGLPLLAAIGFDPEAANKPLISQISKFSSRAESYRQLRTNIEYMRAGTPPQVTTVSSPLPAEGKTTTAINLALSFAEAGHNTLLIEADMRRPTMHNYIQLDRKIQGLSDILSGNTSTISAASLNKIVQKTENKFLSILTSGVVPPNPVELLDSESFRTMMKIFRKSYRYIVIDTPPLLPVSDGAVVAVQTDGVLIVLKAGTTKLGQFKGAIDVLSKVNVKIQGIALNMIPLARNGYAYGYRYGYSYGYKRKYGVYGAADYSGVKLSTPDDRPYGPIVTTATKPKPFEEPGMRPLTRLEKLLAEEKANH